MAMPRLVVSGNCQARFVANLLKDTPAVTEQYGVVYHRNFRRGDQEELGEDTMRKTFVLIEQVAHGVPELPGKEFLPKKAKVIRFPIVWFNSLWPNYTHDARNPPKSEAPQVWPYGDRVILDGLAMGLSPDDAVKRWFDTDIAASLNLDRFHEINAAKSRALDARTELKLGDYALRKFERLRLFSTHNHPSPHMLKVMRDWVFDALGLPPSTADVMPASGGMYHTHVPVHPSVAQHFGLQWWKPTLPARLRDREMSVTEYLTRYAAFDPLTDIPRKAQDEIADDADQPAMAG